MNDLDCITAASWREIEHNQRDMAGIVSGYNAAAYRSLYLASADHCAKMAEAAEGREKCQRGEHRWGVDGTCKGNECLRCGAIFNPTPPADVTREEVVRALRAGERIAYERAARGDNSSFTAKDALHKIADVLEGK